ncbi:MAG: anti-sigma factor domain-containing protein, partial [Firmicutes bacterium]|nr:anti-sigma factor domain-containing protein [Bacillota bacterium]
MRGQRGLVLELEKGLAVVLTPDGQYRRIAAGREWELGQEVQFEATVAALPQALPQRPRLHPAWLAAAVVLLALLVPGTLSVRSLLSRPALAAYVAVDINPSLELQVDAGGKVLAAQAVNDDAVPLLQALSLKGLPLDQAVRAITEKAVAAGYLSQSNDNMVLITVTPKASGADVPQAVQQQVAASQQAAAAVLNQRGLKNDVEALSAPAEVRDAAKSQGIPTGKLFVASEAARQGTVIDR